MKHFPFNYVRTFRKRFLLSAEELGYLIGQRGPSAVCRYERGERVPKLEEALALEIIFGQAPRQMFPEFYEAVEERVMRRAAKLLEQLEAGDDRRSEAKRELLEELPRRGIDNGQGL